MSAEPPRAAEQPPALPEPDRRPAPAARWVWRAHWAGGCLAALVAGGIASGPVSGTAAVLLWVLPLVALVVGTPVVPELRWRRWRWAVHAHEIDIRHGMLTVRRTLIPMARVQHVETERGVFEQLFELATVKIHTAAGSHTIPLLAEGDAGRLRAQIAELARTDA